MPAKALRLLVNSTVEYGFAKGLATLGVGNGLVKRPLRSTLRINRDVKSLLRQLVHEGGKALTFGAQAIGHRDAHVGKEQLRGVRRMLPNLVEVAPPRKARPISLYQNQADALAAARRTSPRHDDDQVGVLPIGNIGFGPIDDIGVAVAHSRRTDAL